MPKRQKSNRKKIPKTGIQNHHVVIFILGAASGFMLIVTFFVTIIMHDELVNNRTPRMQKMAVTVPQFFMRGTSMAVAIPNFTRRKASRQTGPTNIQPTTVSDSVKQARVSINVSNNGLTNPLYMDLAQEEFHVSDINVTNDEKYPVTLQSLTFTKYGDLANEKYSGFRLMKNGQEQVGLTLFALSNGKATFSDLNISIPQGQSLSLRLLANIGQLEMPFVPQATLGFGFENVHALKIKNANTGTPTILGPSGYPKKSDLTIYNSGLNAGHNSESPNGPARGGLDKIIAMWNFTAEVEKDITVSAITVENKGNATISITRLTNSSDDTTNVLVSGGVLAPGQKLTLPIQNLEVMRGTTQTLVLWADTTGLQSPSIVQINLTDISSIDSKDVVVTEQGLPVFGGALVY